MKRRNRMEFASEKVKMIDKVRVFTLVASAGGLIATAIIGEIFAEEPWYEQLYNTVMTFTVILLLAAAVATFMKVRARKDQEVQIGKAASGQTGKKGGKRKR